MSLRLVEKSRKNISKSRLVNHAELNAILLHSQALANHSIFDSSIILQ